MKRIVNTLRKLIVWVAFVVLILVFIFTISVYESEKKKMQFVSEQLNSEANFDAVLSAYLKRFELGMTRNEVIEATTKLDPDLLEFFKNNDLSCTRLMSCCESIYPFKDHIHSMLAHVFCYDKDLKLISINIRS